MAKGSVTPSSEKKGKKKKDGEKEKGKEKAEKKKGQIPNNDPPEVSGIPGKVKGKKKRKGRSSTPSTEGLRKGKSKQDLGSQLLAGSEEREESGAIPQPPQKSEDPETRLTCTEIVEELLGSAWEICAERFLHQNGPKIVTQELRDTWLRIVEVQWLDQDLPNSYPHLPENVFVGDEPPLPLALDTWSRGAIEVMPNERRESVMDPFIRDDLPGMDTTGILFNNSSEDSRSIPPGPMPSKIDLRKLKGKGAKGGDKSGKSPKIKIKKHKSRSKSKLKAKTKSKSKTKPKSKSKSSKPKSKSKSKSKPKSKSKSKSKIKKTKSKSKGSRSKSKKKRKDKHQRSKKREPMPPPKTDLDLCPEGGGGEDRICPRYNYPMVNPWCRNRYGETRGENEWMGEHGEFQGEGPLIQCSPSAIPYFCRPPRMLRPSNRPKYSIQFLRPPKKMSSYDNLQNPSIDELCQSGTLDDLWTGGRILDETALTKTGVFRLPHEVSSEALKRARKMSDRRKSQVASYPGDRKKSQGGSSLRGSEGAVEGIADQVQPHGDHRASGGSTGASLQEDKNESVELGIGSKTFQVLNRLTIKEANFRNQAIRRNLWQHTVVQNAVTIHQDNGGMGGGGGDAQFVQTGLNLKNYDGGRGQQMNQFQVMTMGQEDRFGESQLENKGLFEQERKLTIEQICNGIGVSGGGIPLEKKRMEVQVYQTEDKASMMVLKAQIIKKQREKLREQFLETHQTQQPNERGDNDDDDEPLTQTPSQESKGSKWIKYF